MTSLQWHSVQDWVVLPSASALHGAQLQLGHLDGSTLDLCQLLPGFLHPLSTCEVLPET